MELVLRESPRRRVAKFKMFLRIFLNFMDFMMFFSITGPGSFSGPKFRPSDGKASFISSSNSWKRACWIFWKSGSPKCSQIGVLGDRKRLQKWRNGRKKGSKRCHHETLFVYKGNFMVNYCICIIMYLGLSKNGILLSALINQSLPHIAHFNFNCHLMGI